MDHRQTINVVELISDLAGRGVTLWREDDQLHYRAPKDALNPPLLNTLKQHKSAILDWLYERATTENCYPLTQGQLGLWLDWQRNPHSGSYNLVNVARLHVGVQIDLLRQAAQLLLDRHPTLRTVYRLVDDQPQQQVQAQQRLAFTQIDGTGWTQSQIDGWIEREAARPFDLSCGPLMRMLVLQIKGNQQQPIYLLHWTIHHIATDLFTQEILNEELLTCYRALRQGQSPLLPTSSLTYRDFVRWEQDVLRIHDAHLATFWQKQLGDAPLLLNLPRCATLALQRDKENSPPQTRSFTINSTLTMQLRAAARAHQTTLYTFLLTTYQILISRYTGQDAFFVSTPTAVRDLEGWNRTVGYLVNPILLRADLAENPSFATLLRRTQQTVTDALAHHLYPYHTLLRYWHKQIASGQLAQGLAGFVFDLVRPQTLDSDLFATILMGRQWGMAEPLTLSIFEQKEVLEGCITYEPDWFDAAFIERMEGHFVTLLQAIVDNPDQPISQLPLLRPAERHQLLVEWNDTTQDYPQDKTIQQLFEAQVERTPDALAVLMAKRDNLPPATCHLPPDSLTYAQLNARANQLAHHLQTLGVGPDVLVGICVERSIEMVVGLLGILKAGGAYVPLDPSYPPERLAFMLQDSEVSVLLTQAQLCPSLPPSQATIICLDRDWMQIAEQPTSQPLATVEAHHLAYMIYTSGSTGRPKGALNAHRGVVNRLLWMQAEYQLTPQDRVLQKTPFSFDVSVWEFFWPLFNGAQLVVAQPEGHKDPAYLVEVIQQQQITTLHFVPSMLSAFLEAENLQQCTSLRQVFCSGEALAYELQQRFFAHLSAQLHNLYGPTEAAVDVTFWACQPKNELRIVPIGRPVANTQMYVLDRQLQPVPIGVAAELHIGGIQVGLGYHKRPELTAEKFIANPFGEGKLYKTGDLCRWLADGNIEYLGRIDHQVKIRGFRIELGEIEAVLSQHPAVQEAVVIAREDIAGEKRLVAYLVQVAGGKLQVANLHTYLQQKLPDYMIPSAFVLLDALPLNPNGKVDRKALPVPDNSSLETAVEISAPHTAREVTLVTIWQQVLHRNTVGLDDSFFSIGGDSILSIQVVTRARQAGLKITPHQIFQYQTIRQLAAVAVPTHEALLIPQEPVTGELPLTPIQAWFLEQAWSEPHHFNQAMLFEAAADVNPLWLEAALLSLLQHHDALRLRFECVQGKWQQTNTGQTETVALQVVDLASLSHQERMERLRAEANHAQATLDLADGPLLRAVLFRYGPQTPGRLLLVIHHLAVDGVSWRILLEDLQTAYVQSSRSEAISLPAKTTSFRDWAHWLVDEGVQRVIAEQAWWQKVVQEIQDDFPVDFPAGLVENKVSSIEEVVCLLSPAETQALLQEAPAAYHTQINDLLLTALAQTISQWSGKPQVTLALEGHGRELFNITEDDEHGHSLDLSRTVGWFTSLFPIVLHQDQTESGELIKSIKEQLRRIPNRGIGYGILRYLAQVNELIPATKIALSFNYLGQFDATLVNTSAANAALLLDFAPEASGQLWSPQGWRSHLLDVNAMIVQGELRLIWSYSRHIHKRATIEDLGQRYLEALRQLIAHCCSTLVSNYTPSDFSAPDIDQTELDQLLAQFA